MSYPGLPRLVFAGQFQADPSTVNNDPEHFDSGTFKSSQSVLQDVKWGTRVARGSSDE